MTKLARILQWQSDGSFLVASTAQVLIRSRLETMRTEVEPPKVIATGFATHEEAVDWCRENGYTVTEKVREISGSYDIPL